MLSVIIKGTNGCNLNCSYCSVGKKVKVHIAGAQELLDMFRYACGLCRYRKEKRLTFILHGGEPTLLAAKDYRYAVDTVRQEYPDIQIRLLMQSNGFHLDPEMLAFIQDYDVGVGISLDGCEEVQDVQRRSASGEPTFAAVTENIRRLSERGVHVSCLMVLTSNALDKGYGYLKYFAENGIHLKINPLLNYGEASEHPELSLESGQYASYLIGMYRYIVKQELDVEVSPLDQILRGVLDGGNIRACTFDVHCHQKFLCIDYKGDLYPCGKYADMHQYKIGSIKDTEYDILSSGVMRELAERRTTCLPQACVTCRYQKICHAGCSAEACISKTDRNVPELCGDYYELFSFFHGEGLRLLKQQLLRQKEQLLQRQGQSGR